MQMGGGMLDDWELTPSARGVSTIVVVGKTGNGKSATGNSILGRKAFVSDFSFSGVTNTSELQTAVLKDGRRVNVIDTPGLFDFSIGSEYVCKEIVNCINLAKDGIHAVLMVFSITSRFTREEEAAIQSMKSFFGDKITDYMIVVFTGGDTLECNGKTLKDLMSRGCPEPLKKILQLCKNRVMVFNNSTEDKTTRARQVNQLFSLVDSVVADNGGQPFSDQNFAELKEGALRLRDKEKEIEAMKEYSEQQKSELKKQLQKSHDDQISQIAEIVEKKLNTAIENLREQLAQEQAARLESEKGAQEARRRSDEEIRKLREELWKGQQESQEFEQDLFYQKSLDNINNEISNDQIAFSKDSNALGSIATIGDKTLIRQNNMIIEMLVSINKKLDVLNNILIKQTPIDPSITESIEKVTQQLTRMGTYNTRTPRMGKNMLVWNKFN